MITLIFDNGGGLTLQTAGYAHRYDDMAQAASDYNQIDRGQSPLDWDGNDADAAALAPTWDEVRNGGYSIYIDANVGDFADYDGGWANIINFADALSEVQS